VQDRTAAALIYSIKLVSDDLPLGAVPLHEGTYLCQWYQRRDNHDYRLALGELHE